MNNNGLIDDLFKKHKTYNPFKIVENLGIELQYVHFKNSRPLGQTVRDEVFDYTMILLDDTLKYKKQSFFVCAHELCHALIHEELHSYYIANYVTHAKLEVEANRFAVQLAVADYTNVYGEPPRYFEELEREYGVPDEFLDMYF